MNHDNLTVQYVALDNGDNSVNQLKVTDADSVINFVPIDLENTDYFKIKQKIDNGDLTIADAD
jgi:hypothetical protein